MAEYDSALFARNYTVNRSMLETHAAVCG